MSTWELLVVKQRRIVAKSDTEGRFLLIPLALRHNEAALDYCLSFMSQVLELSYSQFLTGLATDNPNLIKFSQIIFKLGPVYIGHS